jgi:hypothetical protein
MRNYFGLAIIIAVVLVMAGLSIRLGFQQTTLAPHPAETMALAEPPAVNRSMVSFLAVGDIMLSRYVAERMEQNDNPLLPFDQLEDLLSSTDFNFGNLESPVSGNDQKKGAGWFLFTDPEAAKPRQTLDRRLINDDCNYLDVGGLVCSRT